MLPGKGLKLLKIQPGRLLWGGKCTDKMLCGGYFESREQLCCCRVVAQQECPLAIGQADDPFGQKADEANLRPNLTSDQLVWLPGLQPRMIGPQDICDQQGIARVVAGSTLSETPTRTPHLVGMQNVELGVSLVP